MVPGEVYASQVDTDDFNIGDLVYISRQNPNTLVHESAGGWIDLDDSDSELGIGWDYFNTQNLVFEHMSEYAVLSISNSERILTPSQLKQNGLKRINLIDIDAVIE